MAQRDTKQKILESALDLFSVKGYDGVGVDLIAERAGIKGPSLYKHFKGKEDILDKMLESISEYYALNFGLIKDPEQIPSSMDELISITRKKINFTINDPVIIKVRKLLSMEQFRSEKIARMHTLHTSEALLSMFTKIFSVMMENGSMKKDDPATLAMEYTYPISILISICDREPELKPEMEKRIDILLTHFAERYRP